MKRTLPLMRCLAWSDVSDQLTSKIVAKYALRHTTQADNSCNSIWVKLTAKTKMADIKVRCMVETYKHVGDSVVDC